MKFLALTALLGCLVSTPISAVVRITSPEVDQDGLHSDLSGVLGASMATPDPVARGWLNASPRQTQSLSREEVKTDWPSGRCVKIDSVRLPGLQLLSSRVVTRVYALVQPEMKQCLDPERLDGLASQINEVLRKEDNSETVATLPERPIRNRVLTIRFNEAAMGEPKVGAFDPGHQVTSFKSKSTDATSTGSQVFAADALPSYTFGRWTRPAGLASVAPVKVTESDSATTRNTPSLSLQHVRRHWLGSHLQFAGNSSQTRDGHQGQIGVEADNLIRANHALSLNFNESESQRIENEAEAFALHYAFPLGDNYLNFDVDSFSYQSTVIGDDRKYESSGEGRNIYISGRRSLFSWQGINFDTIMSLSSHDASYFEQGRWTEDSSRQLSSFMLEGQSSHELLYGVQATTRVSAASGLEVMGKDYDIEDSLNEDDSYRKFTLSGSLSREVLRWQWGVTGHYQFSPDDLPDSEYLLVVGPSMIEGFNGQSLAAAEGGWLRLDASSPRFDFPLMSSVRSGVRFSVLRGWVPYNQVQADRYGSASAAEISLQMQGRGIQAGFSVGRMLGASSLATTKPDVPDVSLSLSMGI